jgi:hypothetical protein
MNGQQVMIKPTPSPIIMPLHPLPVNHYPRHGHGGSNMMLVPMQRYGGQPSVMRHLKRGFNGSGGNLGYNRLANSAPNSFLSYLINNELKNLGAIAEEDVSLTNASSSSSLSSLHQQQQQQHQMSILSQVNGRLLLREVGHKCEAVMTTASPGDDDEDEEDDRTERDQSKTMEVDQPVDTGYRDIHQIEDNDDDDEETTEMTEELITVKINPAADGSATTTTTTTVVIMKKSSSGGGGGVERRPSFSSSRNTGSNNNSNNTAALSSSSSSLNLTESVSIEAAAAAASNKQLVAPLVNLSSDETDNAEERKELERGETVNVNEGKRLVHLIGKRQEQQSVVDQIKTANEKVKLLNAATYQDVDDDEEDCIVYI